MLLDGAATIALPIALVGLAVSVVVVVAGFGQRSDLLRQQARRPGRDRIGLHRTALAAGTLDVAAEAMAALRGFESLAAQRFVNLELAVQPGLTIRADARALGEILGDLLEEAIRESACGRVLLTAGRIGGRVQIGVSDDGQQGDRGLRASRLRPAERLAALHGATMDIDVRRGLGTTVVLRFPAEAAGRRSRGETSTVDPTSVWTQPQETREDSSASR